VLVTDLRCRIPTSDEAVDKTKFTKDCAGTPDAARLKRANKRSGNIDIGNIKYVMKPTLPATSITSITTRANTAWPDHLWIDFTPALAAM